MDTQKMKILKIVSSGESVPELLTFPYFLANGELIHPGFRNPPATNTILIFIDDDTPHNGVK